jgi:GT2 family glycosyltransferase
MTSKPAAGRATNSSDHSGPQVQAATVIVPMKDAAQTISATLEGLAAQDFPSDFEVVVVDNGSTDCSVDIVSKFDSDLPGLRLIQAPDRAGAAYARNVGAALAKGEIFAFCDADDIPHKDWLRSLIQACGGTEAAGGRLVALQDGTSSRVGVQEQGLPGLMGYLPWSCSGNLAIPRAAFNAIDGFDEDLPICEDVDFSWRLQQAGYTLRFCPDAVVQYRSRSGNVSNARRCFAYAVGDVLVYKRHAQFGARRRSLVGAMWDWLKLIVSLPRVLSNTLRPRYVNSVAKRLGWLVGSIKHRTFYP